MLRNLYPKIGDWSKACNYCIDLKVRMHDDTARLVDTAHYIWHKIRMASFQHKRSFPHAPYIQALIDRTASFPIAKTCVQKRWTSPTHMTEVVTVKGKALVIPPQRTASMAPYMREPLGRTERFIGMTQSAIMKAITFNCSQNHDVQTRLIV